LRKNRPTYAFYAFYFRFNFERIRNNSDADTDGPTLDTLLLSKIFSSSLTYVT